MSSGSRLRAWLLTCLTIVLVTVQSVSAQNEVYTNRLAIGIAIEADDASTLKRIADRGGNLEEPNLFGLTPLMQAAADGSPACASFLISRHVKVDATSMEGFPAAYYAVWIAAADPSKHDPAYLDRRARVLRLLIDATADISGSAWPVRGFTLVHIAALCDNLPALEVLAAAGADLNAEGTYEETPLMIAASHGNLAIVDFLVQHGVDVNRETVGEQNALDYARSWPDVVARLKAAGAHRSKYATQLYDAFGGGNS